MNWLEENVFGWLFRDREITLPLAVWILAALVGVLGWVL